MSKRETHDHDRVQWAMDQLTALMGRFLAGQADSPGYDDPRFLRWLTESSALPGECGTLPPETLHSARERILRGAAELRSGVQRIDAAAPVHPAPVTGPLMEVVEVAARERSAPRIPQAVAAGTGRDLWEEECDQWVHLPAEVPSGRFIALTVAGESMTPLLHPGDVVLVRLGPTAARDAVVVARHPDNGYVVKLVGAARDRELELFSLNPEYAPIRVPRDDRAVVGTVVLRWCDHQAATVRSH